MFGRCPPLAQSVVLCVLLLPAAGAARAHRLDAQAFLLPGKKIQVESWFSSGEAARNARVRVLRAGGNLMTEGQTNEQGIYVFSYDQPEDLTVVVASTGHQATVAVHADQLGQSLSAVQPMPLQEAGPVPLANRSTGVTLRDVVSGVGFLFAFAAFLLSVRNARRLRQLDSRP